MIRPVSSRLSPFRAEDDCAASAADRTLMRRWCAATSNDRRVLVNGSKNIVST